MPCLDVGAHRLPCLFVDRSGTDTEGAVKAVADLVATAGVDESVMVYPEGTRFSPEKQEKLAAYQSVKNNLDEMLDTLFSTTKVKNSVSSKLKKSIKNGYFSDIEGKEIRNEVMEAHCKYMAFGETLSRTTYSNKQLINDYHNFIYRIIEKIDSATLKSEE